MSDRYDCSDPEQRAAGLKAAVDAVRRGELVVLPTDTVYGIGADAFTPHAITGLLIAKRRSRDMPPPVLVGTVRAATALWGGTDGLDAIRAIEGVARRLLRPGGRVAVEHGAVQGAAVYWVFAEEEGWRETRNHQDLAGRDRFVTAMLP